MERRPLFIALTAMSLMTAPQAALGGAWPNEAGWTYTELSASSFSADRVSGGIDTLRTTNSSLRLYSELSVSRRLALLLNVPLADHHRFGPARSTRFGDLSLGARYTAASGRRWAVAPSFSVQIPTVFDERRLGAPFVNADGVTTFANDATGVVELQPGLLGSWHLGPLWGDLGVGYAWRLGYADQFSGAAQVWLPLIAGGSVTGGLHTRTNLRDLPRTGPVLANGVGESAEFQGWYARADYRLPSGFGLGIGYDSSLHLVDYPASPAVSLRLSFSGRLWRAARPGGE